MTQQEQLDAFIKRAGFSYGWQNLESWARRMAEQAVAEQADSYTTHRVASACVAAGISDSQFESLCIALKEPKP
jgi:hypothetical protein